MTIFPSIESALCHCYYIYNYTHRFSSIAGLISGLFTSKTEFGLKYICSHLNIIKQFMQLILKTVIIIMEVSILLDFPYYDCKRYKCFIYVSNSFFYLVHRLWNSLPDTVRCDFWDAFPKV